MPLASDFGTGQVFLSFLWFFLFFIWIWLLIVVFSDLFRSHDLSGWAKAAWVIGIIILPYFGVLIYLIARGHKMAEHAQEAAAAQNAAAMAYIQQAAGTTPTAKVEVGNAPATGPKNAPVTIVEWSDFQCPYCGRVEPTLQQLRQEYEGKIRLAWKNQPLSFHPNAMPAAEAAMAADEQGKFWEFHDALFKQQDKLGPGLYDEVAKQIGLDLNRFHASIAAHKHAAQIQADMAAGSSVGADGTPTFFINGKKLVGALPVDSFKQVIDAELAAQVAKK